ncbi:hypothetical protein AG1IA_08368 [Rhizoctonia solani AG-1 IA]|uniref:Uncharacterized protein n=1 Tax=Thanatephorus cucumeris (strain AG1-IA) TaxID=983506 RepID=L8WI40_THACA|nr:hypothetical protein AG1IA_08368 [Rhizoctonia solani AG-1 IA]
MQYPPTLAASPVQKTKERLFLVPTIPYSRIDNCLQPNGPKDEPQRRKSHEE